MGAVCSHAGSVQVAPQRESILRKQNSLTSSCQSRRIKRSSKKVSWQRRCSSPGEGQVLNVHMDACLLPLFRISQNMGLESEFYKHPVVVVKITVTLTDTTKPYVIHEPTIDWGKLIVVNQVPKKLPDSLAAGTVVLHAILAKGSPVLVDIKLRGTVNGEKVEYSADVEKDVPYMSDPIVLADTLQVLQDQLHEEANVNGDRDSKRHFSIDTGYSTCSKSFSHAPRNMDDITDAVSEDEKSGDQNKLVSKRKNTPVVSNVLKPRKLSSLRTRIEAMSFREEDEETEDDCVFTRRMSRRISKLSSFGRMSRMSRRYSRCSVGGDSTSSLMVNPPGGVRNIQSRVMRSRRDSRWSEQCSISEYRQRPGEISDFETSAAESARLTPVSSIGANWSESSYNGRRVSFDLWADKGDDASATETSSRGQSPSRSCLKDGRKGPSKDVCCCRVIQEGNRAVSSARSVRNNTGVQLKRQRRPTPISFQRPKPRSLALVSPVISEEQDPGEETEEDGYTSACNYGHRLSSRLNYRRKRFSKRRITNSDMLDMSKSGQFSSTTTPLRESGDLTPDMIFSSTLEEEVVIDEGQGQEYQSSPRCEVAKADEQSNSPSSDVKLAGLADTCRERQQLESDQVREVSTETLVKERPVFPNEQRTTSRQDKSCIFSSDVRPLEQVEPVSSHPLRCTSVDELVLVS